MDYGDSRGVWGQGQEGVLMVVWCGKGGGSGVGV